MKIAALIQAHHRPEQLSLLLDRLSGDLWSPFVHIDRKADIGKFGGLLERATFLERRVRVNWGGLSQVEASLLLMREALKDPTITHVYHMSGECYPVKSDEQISDRVASLPAGAANLMSLQAMPVSHKPLERYTKRFLNDVRNPVLRKVLRRLSSYLPGQSVSKLRGIHLYGGSSWWLFERGTAEKLLGFVDENPWYWRLFRYSGFPDEMLLHTLIAPLGIAIGGESPTAATWVDGKANPEPVTEAMHARFVCGPDLFARKYVAFHPASAERRAACIQSHAPTSAIE